MSGVVRSPQARVLVLDCTAAEERAEQHASLDRAVDCSDAGRGMDAWEFLERH
jgi:hypothetical protein